VSQFRLVLFRPHHSDDIFQEIDAAFFTLAALPLFVLARRTLITQRGMAALAKTRNVAHLAIALGAVHKSILCSLEAPRERSRFPCAHTVT
jgi:hypothetical protein